MKKNIVQIKDVVKRFGNVLALDHVSLEIPSGEFFSILGPSGCGKTTLLRLIAGFEIPDSGEIFLEDKMINSTPPYRRNVNTVFQNYALFPHMNIYDNVAFGLKLKGIGRAEIKERVMRSLDLVGLSGMGDRKPRQLSGGQQQRVALSRALVNEPPVLLLDEPLGALDLKLRRQMQVELKSLQKRLGITFIYVTHDQEEALTMSDRIAIMQTGKIEQMDIPPQIYERPRTEFVANFIGISNLFSGNLRNGNGKIYTLTTSDGFEIKATGEGIRPERNATVMVRPEKIQITPGEPKNMSHNINILQGKIEDMIYLGNVIQFIVKLKEQKLIVLEKNYDKTFEFKPDQDVFVSWDIYSTFVLSERVENERLFAQV
ncbi:MAG TPA: ABC transporter ATP-binding protein [Candidatus Eremiobacteraeota bacterium]|nr:ABC transporter ATP-binding protein [Candidatus Eremiobacteraeota bacterium]